MNEKITGLGWKDFVGINLGIRELIKTYQALVDNGSPMSLYWAHEIRALEATLNRIEQNRSIER